jgi:hypothetical protein
MSTDATPRCRWCGQPFHQGICPTVKAMEFHPDGTMKRVEFWSTDKVEPVDKEPKA